jgi:glycine betaine/proline transport system permease protein
MPRQRSSLVSDPGSTSGTPQGAVVVRGISTLDVGAGFEGGIAVVFLAIYLDRLTQSLATTRRRRPKRRAQATEPAPTDQPADQGVLVNS